MNCSEFVWHCQVDPHSRDALFIQHRQDCVTCAWRHRREVKFNAQMQSALSVAAPQQLLDRLLQIPG